MSTLLFLMVKLVLTSISIFIGIIQANEGTDLIRPNGNFDLKKIIYKIYVAYSF